MLLGGGFLLVLGSGLALRSMAPSADAVGRTFDLLLPLLADFVGRVAGVASHVEGGVAASFLGSSAIGQFSFMM